MTKENEDGFNEQEDTEIDQAQTRQFDAPLIPEELDEETNEWDSGTDTSSEDGD